LDRAGRQITGRHSALVTIMRNPKSATASRVTACGMILDRAFGRPNLPIGVNVKINPEDLSDAELARILAETGAWKPRSRRDRI
jgi:hypothetical protein